MVGLDLWRRLQLALAAGVLWLALANTAVLASSQWTTWTRTHFDLPLAPGRALHVHIGNPWAYRSITSSYYDVEPQRPFQPLRISVRYRVMSGWQGRQLMVAHLPTWPPLLMLPSALASLALVMAAPRWLAARSR